MGLLQVCVYVLFVVRLSRTQESANHDDLSVQRFVRQNPDFFQDLMAQFQRMNDQVAQQWVPALSQISDGFQQGAPLLQQVPLLGQSLAQSILSSSDSLLGAFGRSNGDEDDEETAIQQTPASQKDKEQSEGRQQPKQPLDMIWGTPLLGLQSFMQNPPPPFNYNPFITGWSNQMQQASASDISEVRVKPDIVDPTHRLSRKTTRDNNAGDTQNYPFSNAEILRKNMPLLWLHVTKSKSVNSKNPKDKQTQAKLSTFKDELVLELQNLQKVVKLANQVKRLKPYSTNAGNSKALSLSEISVYKMTMGDIEEALKDEDVLTILHTLNQYRRTTPNKRQISSNDLLQKLSAEDLMKIIGYNSRMSPKLENNWMKGGEALKSTELDNNIDNMKYLVNEAAIGKSTSMLHNPALSYWPGLQPIERQPTVNPSPLPTQWPPSQLKEFTQTGVFPSQYWMGRALTHLPQQSWRQLIQSMHMFEPKMRQQQQDTQLLTPAVNTLDNVDKNDNYNSFPSENQITPPTPSSEMSKLSQVQQVPEAREFEQRHWMSKAMMQLPQQSFPISDPALRQMQNDFPVVSQPSLQQLSEIKRTDTINPQHKPKKNPTSSELDSNRTGMKPQLPNEDDLSSERPDTINPQHKPKKNPIPPEVDSNRTGTKAQSPNEDNLKKNEQKINYAGHRKKVPENARHSSNLYGTAYDNYDFLYYPQIYPKLQHTSNNKLDRISCPLVVNNYYGDCSTTPTNNLNALGTSHSGHNSGPASHLSTTTLCAETDTGNYDDFPVTAASALFGPTRSDVNSLVTQRTHVNASPYKMAIGDDEILKMLQENKALPNSMMITATHTQTQPHSTPERDKQQGQQNISLPNKQETRLDAQNLQYFNDLVIYKKPEAKYSKRSKRNANYYTFETIDEHSLSELRKVYKNNLKEITLNPNENPTETLMRYDAESIREALETVNAHPEPIQVIHEPQETVELNKQHHLLSGDMGKPQIAYKVRPRYNFIDKQANDIKKSFNEMQSESHYDYYNLPLRDHIGIEPNAHIKSKKEPISHIRSEYGLTHSRTDPTSHYQSSKGDQIFRRLINAISDDSAKCCNECQRTILHGFEEILKSFKCEVCEQTKANCSDLLNINETLESNFSLKRDTSHERFVQNDLICNETESVTGEEDVANSSQNSVVMRNVKRNTQFTQNHKHSVTSSIDDLDQSDDIAEILSFLNELRKQIKRNYKKRPEKQSKALKDWKVKCREANGKAKNEKKAPTAK
uniref:DEC-1 protein N-terminal domain-containing protein n=1 Tax=Glossina morsitans morsitans TaxID=37546 RepID=A0A1B0FAT4_GLOMM